MKEYKGDKRSKAYKEWKKKHQADSVGLGDTVAKITKASGIEKAVKFLAGEDCGCDKRKEVLNHIFPYQKPLCLTEIEYNYLDSKIDKLSTVTIEEQKHLLGIYNRVFKDTRELTACGSCFLNGVWKKLERIFKEYN
tara:strand:+ start:594 stop:1004 length:411 start_codon:yes stop_codon:yes gene_type:complete